MQLSSFKLKYTKIMTRNIRIDFTMFIKIQIRNMLLIKQPVQKNIGSYNQNFLIL